MLKNSTVVEIRQKLCWMNSVRKTEYFVHQLVFSTSPIHHLLMNYFFFGFTTPDIQPLLEKTAWTEKKKLDAIIVIYYKAYRTIQN